VTGSFLYYNSARDGNFNHANHSYVQGGIMKRALLASLAAGLLFSLLANTQPVAAMQATRMNPITAMYCVHRTLSG
jgi:hypothetical protein